MDEKIIPEKTKFNVEKWNKPWKSEKEKKKKKRKAS